MAAYDFSSDPRLAWMRDENIRPYVFVRPENRIPDPGRFHKGLNWFPHEVIYKNPMEMDQLAFADRIMELESKAFGPSGMAMPRWVFYDCAIVPGFVAGFAVRTESLPEDIKKVIPTSGTEEWTPLSLFIIIPTMSKDGEWVAHNLCSVNSILPKEKQYYGIGFISKAFGLWYANVRSCCGMTQWMSPSLRLHAHYGDFEILTSYTPVHSYARTVTYRLIVDVTCWPDFFTKAERVAFKESYRPAGFSVDPTNDGSLISFQKRLETGEGPFFLNSQEVRVQDLASPLQVYCRR